MIHIVWEFRPKRGQRRRFERCYGPGGDWARLFRKSPGYVRTLLIRDREGGDRYLCIDVWRRLADFRRFKSRFAEVYAALDRRCEALTRLEKRIGIFEEAPGGKRG